MKNENKNDISLITMYKIKPMEKAIRIPCKDCAEKGIVDPECQKCGGNGTHRKKLIYWSAERKPGKPMTEEVIRISRCKKRIEIPGKVVELGELQYWTDSSTFYNENERLLHFTFADAQAECDRRNQKLNITEILAISQKPHKTTREKEELETV